jgi:ribosomal protein S18 acetylase RimI-like enzyme
MTEIHEVTDWRALKWVRLRALADSPNAFMATYEREAAFEDDEWRAKLHDADWFVAREDGEVIGVVGLVIGRPPEGARYIESTWVDPDHRRQGVLRSLVARLVGIGREAELDSLYLWVVGDNEVAAKAYARLGFEETELVQPIDGNGRVERQLRLDVDGQRTER